MAALAGRALFSFWAKNSVCHYRGDGIPYLKALVPSAKESAKRDSPRQHQGCIARQTPRVKIWD